ncbi:MAG: ABC transporter permease [Solirubrobacterales bacterium]
MNFTTNLLATSVALMVPLLLAALGELVSERSGVMNIGLEGMIAAGAYFGFTVMQSSHSAWLAAVVGIGCGMAVAALMVVVCVWGHADQILAGFALFILVPGFVAYLFIQSTSGSTTATTTQADATGLLPSLDVPLLHHIPIVGDSFFSGNGFYYATIVLCVVVWFLITRTRFGLNTQAVGHDPLVAESRGVSVRRVRTLAVLFCGGCAGLAGVALTVGAVGAFTPGIVGGRGFIAIAIVILGRWRIGWTVLAALVVSLCQALELRLTEVAPGFPVLLLGALPWVVVVLMLILGARAFTGAPRALGTQLTGSH